jgi:hypothetical protein
LTKSTESRAFHAIVALGRAFVQLQRTKDTPKSIPASYSLGNPVLVYDTLLLAIPHGSKLEVKSNVQQAVIKVVGSDVICDDLRTAIAYLDRFSECHTVYTRDGQFANRSGDRDSRVQRAPALDRQRASESTLGLCVPSTLQIELEYARNAIGELKQSITAHQSAVNDHTSHQRGAAGASDEMNALEAKITRMRTAITDIDRQLAGSLDPRVRPAGSPTAAHTTAVAVAVAVAVATAAAAAATAVASPRIHRTRSAAAMSSSPSSTLTSTPDTAKRIRREH